MLELKRKDTYGSSVKFSNSSKKLGAAGFTSGGNFVIDGTDDADGSGNMLKIDQSGNQTVTGSETVNKDLTVKGNAGVSGDFSACRNYVRALSSLPGNGGSVTNGHYVLLLGKILNPSSTKINSPYNWDISADFAFIRDSGHNVAFFSVKAGHGYSHNWKTYINIMVDANYNTSLFNPVTCLYNGVYWLAVQFSLANEYYEKKAFIKVARNLDELSLTVLAYKHGSTIDNSEINGSIANVPSGWKVSSLFKQNISVSGNISASGALDVTGDAAIDGALDVGQGMTVCGLLDISGNIRVNNGKITLLSDGTIIGSQMDATQFISERGIVFKSADDHLFLALGFLNFSYNGTITLSNSFNIKSVVREGVGVYKVYFKNIINLKYFTEGGKKYINVITVGHAVDTFNNGFSNPIFHICNWLRNSIDGLLKCDDNSGTAAVAWIRIYFVDNNNDNLIDLKSCSLAINGYSKTWI